MRTEKTEKTENTTKRKKQSELGALGNTAAIAALSACIMFGAVGMYRLTSEGNSTKASEPERPTETENAAESDTVAAENSEV